VPRTGYLGVDIGTQGVRAVVLSAEGARLGEGSAPLTGDLRRGPLHEQDPEQWWSAVVRAVGAAMTGAGADTLIDAVAVDATSGTLVVEDASGHARGPALMYDDARAVEQAGRAQEIGQSLWSALGYRMQPSWALPKVMWLLEQGAVRAGDRIAHQSDHVVRRLTGTPVATDTSHALKTGVDLRDAAWPEDIFASLEVPLAVLPDVVLPGTVLGTVSATAGKETGIPAGTPVRAGMTDGCAAQIGARALTPGSWSSALGTTLVIKGSTPEVVRDPAGAVYCHRNPDGGWLPGGASSTGAGALRTSFPDASGAELDRLTFEAARQPPPLGVTYPLAGSGERFPFVAPDARGFSEPDGTHGDPVRLFSALCHGVAYVERLAYDALGLLGADVSGPVSLSGGASRNDWWNQLRTDVLGRPTMVPDSVEAAAGMAVLAAAPPGELARTADRMVRVRTHYEPDADRAGQLHDGYRRLVIALADRGWLDATIAARVLSRSTDD
jgi:sugar (pentulose or hexulose) kinase